MSPDAVQSLASHNFMRIGVLVIFCALSPWRPSMAQQQQSKPHAGENKASRQKQVIPPTHVVIDSPFPAINYAQNQPTNAQTQFPEKPLPRFLRPEWVIVYITTMYAVMTGLGFWAIRRQADIMDCQAKAMQGNSRRCRKRGNSQADKLL